MASGASGASGGPSGPPQTTPLDLLEVDLSDGSRQVSVLGVTFGVIADGDIGTEWMRCVGFLRVYLYIGWRTIFPDPYKVSLLFSCSQLLFGANWRYCCLVARSQPILVPLEAHQ